MEETTVAVPWDSLPQELVENIGRFPNSRIDVLRFRSVCMSWRQYSKPLPSYNNTSSLFNFPHPTQNGGRFTVYESTIYYIEPARDVPNQRGCLVEEAPYRAAQTFSPVTDFKIKPPPLRMKLNMLKFRVRELCKVYRFNTSSIQKLVILSRSNPPNCNNLALMTICYGGLLLLNSGDMNWIAIGHEYLKGDVITYRGKFYAVNGEGKVVAVDPFSSKLEVVDIAPPPIDRPRYDPAAPPKRLVQSGGGLVLLDVFWDRIYELNEDKHLWLNKTSVTDNRRFFVSLDYTFCASLDCSFAAGIDEAKYRSVIASQDFKNKSWDVNS